MKLEIKCKGATTANISDLLDFQGDLKSLSEINYQKFKAELLDLGFSEPISVWINQDGKKYILNGHQRRRTILNMIAEGIEVDDLPINIVEADDIKQAKRKVLALTSQFGEMTNDSLLDFCEKNELSFDEMLADFRFPELEKLSMDLPLVPEETEGDDEVIEEVETVTKLGDLWELGRHRLLCGDSSNAEDVYVLMNGNTADMFITDPPYGVNYEGKTKEKLKIQNDKMTAEQTHKLWDTVLDNALSVLKLGGAIYATVPARLLQVGFMQSMISKNCLRQCMLWNKGSMVMGHSDYHYKHEPILYGWKEGGSHYFINDRTKTTVIDFAKPARNGEHPTMKPIELWAELINNSSKIHENVLDLFCGSGTTIIACEKINRTGYGMELDPHYCDVIVNRYKDWCEKNNRECVIKLNGNVCNG